MINKSKFCDTWLQLAIVMSNLSLSFVSKLSHTGPILKPRSTYRVFFFFFGSHIRRNIIVKKNYSNSSRVTCSYIIIETVRAKI